MPQINISRKIKCRKLFGTDYRVHNNSRHFNAPLFFFFLKKRLKSSSMMDHKIETKLKFSE